MQAPGSEYDCNVLLLPDIDHSRDEEDSFSMKMAKLKSPVPGIKIRCLQYRVALKYKKDNVSLQFCSDNTVQDDRSIATDLFRAYLKNIREVSLLGEEPKPNATAEPVRTYEIGDRNRVIDHRSRIIIQNPKDYLNGKIDSLLLERIL